MSIQFRLNKLWCASITFYNFSVFVVAIVVKVNEVENELNLVILSF